MKKLILSICTVFCLLAAPLTAVEWGGLVFDETGIVTPDFSDITFKQSNGLSLWVKAPLGADSGFSFSGEVLYKYKLELPKGADPVFTNIIDLPLLKITGDFEAGAGLLSLNAGRFYYMDSSSTIISQIIDGVSLAYNLPLVKLGAFAGYTGLINYLNVPMAITPEKESDFYNLAYPYLPLAFTVELPTLFGNQSLEFDAYYLQDLGSNKQNLFYANLGMSGPITNSLFYNAITSFGFMNFKDLMNYSALTLLVFPTESISISAGASFASGEQASFVNFTSLSTNSVKVAGKIMPKAGFTYTTENLCIDLTGNFALAYEDSKYKPSNTDWTLGIIYNIFTDLQVGFTVETSFDVTGANAHNYDAKLNIALAF